MRQNFHRCPNLRIVSIDASDIAGDRKGASAVVDELCKAKGLTRCVGLADCDVLTAGNRRELLVARVTELRKREGGASALADLGAARGREIAKLAEELVTERDEILATNRRLLAEATAAFDDRTDDAPLGTAEDLARPDLEAISLAFRTARLDAIDRALEEVGADHSVYGVCARCRGTIDVDRLRRTPDTHACQTCAESAPPLA